MGLTTPPRSAASVGTRGEHLPVAHANGARGRPYDLRPARRLTPVSLVIANYDPDWPLHFEREAEAVRAVPAVRAVEHVGSTAVPGLAARPTIDLLVGVADPAAAPPEPFEALGYAEERAAPVRTFWKGSRTFRTYELVVVEAGGVEWDRRIALRDRLRADPAAAERYTHRKRELAREHKGDPAAYAEAKRAFIDTLLEN